MDCAGEDGGGEEPCCRTKRVSPPVFTSFKCRTRANTLRTEVSSCGPSGCRGQASWPKSNCWCASPNLAPLLVRPRVGHDVHGHDVHGRSAPLSRRSTRAPLQSARGRLVRQSYAARARSARRSPRLGAQSAGSASPCCVPRRRAAPAAPFVAEPSPRPATQGCCSRWLRRACAGSLPRRHRTPRGLSKDLMRTAYRDIVIITNRKASLVPYAAAIT